MPQTRLAREGTIKRLQRAPGSCNVDGCAGVPVVKGKCRDHLVWSKRNPDRLGGRAVARLRDQLTRRDGYRCRHPDAGRDTCTLDTVLEVHHLDGDVTHNALTNLELRCRRHNPRGGGLHRH